MHLQITAHIRPSLFSLVSHLGQLGIFSRILSSALTSIPSGHAETFSEQILTGKPGTSVIQRPYDTYVENPVKGISSKASDLCQDVCIFIYNHMQTLLAGYNFGVYCASLTYGRMGQCRPKGSKVVRSAHEKEKRTG